MKIGTDIKTALRSLHKKGATDSQIAKALGEPRRRIGQFRRRAGLACNGHRCYSPADYAFLRSNYGKRPVPAIAKRLGRTVTSIYQAAVRLGLSKSVPRLADRPGLVDRLKARHADGWSDTEIGGELHVDRHHVAGLRRKLGLPDNRWTEHMREKVRRNTAEQLRKAGLPSIGYLRVEAFKKRAREQGWPEDLKPRQVQILNLLWDNGPLTREELCRKLGMRKMARKLPGGRVGYWYPMHCNTVGHSADTSYTGSLLKRGLIINLGRVVRNKRPGDGNGQGRNTCLYSLPLDITRSLHARKEA